MAEYPTGARKPFTATPLYRGGVNIETLAAGKTLDAQSSTFQVLDPGGANRDITLPALEDGLTFTFANTADATENLVIKNAAGSTVTTVNRGESAQVVCDGAAWGVAMTPPGAHADFGSTGLKTDVVAESTSAAGVTVDGTLIKDGSVTTADAGSITTNTIAEKTAASGVTVDGCLIKDGRAAAMATAAYFLSTEQTGNGAAQNVAHGFGAAPTLAFVIPSDLSGGVFTVAYGAHDATNVVVTVTTGEKYRVVAFK